MKKKNFYSISIILLLAPILNSCFATDNSVDIKRKSIPFFNESSEYKINNTFVETYFLPDGHVPYLDVNDFIQTLNGFFDTSVKNYRTFTNPLNDSFTITWYANNYKLEFSLNWVKNTIEVNDLYFFNFIKSTSETNYSSFLSTATYWSSNTNPITFNLEDYGIDLLYFKGKVLVPLVILNTLFCSSNYLNVYYNGQNLFAYDVYLSSSQSNYSEIKSGPLANSKSPLDVRQMTLSSLKFTLDYFYGLKSYKGITDFNKYMGDELQSQILSTDPSIYNEAYLELFQKELDDLHTNLVTPSFYDDPSYRYSLLEGPYVGSFWKEFYSLYSELGIQRKERFNSDTAPIYRMVDNTAIITFDSFDTGTKDQIYNADGTVKEDAYKYDTYYLMKYALKHIQANRNIQNIIIDLTHNGGGNLGACYRALGFLTDTPIQSASYDYLTHQYTYYTMNVDSDGKEKNDTNDSYSNYHWSILTSLNTFSAANYFTAIAKNMGIASIIGQQSGGGMCSVLPIVLADGTTARISSPNALMTVKQDEQGVYHFTPVQKGIAVDASLDSSNFYNDTYLANFVNNLH